MRTMPRTAILLALIALVAQGCSRRAETSPWLAEALAVHHRADVQLERGEVDAARKSLVKLIERPAPAGLVAADDRAVRQDAYFRLVDLELGVGRPAEALAWSDAGLALGDGGDLFAANLQLGRGRALEALGRDQEAAAAYSRALDINEQLLGAALADEAPRGPQGRHGN